MNQISFGSLANFSSAVPWGLWVSIYVWLVGISAGSFALVMWGNLRDNPYLKKLTRPAILLSLSTLLVGLLSIQIDLGHMERFHKLFSSPSPTSVMAWMVWLYAVYFVVLVISLLSLKKGISKASSGLIFIFALAIIVGESLLFAVPPGKEWHSVLFPVHFLTTSLVAAISALIFTVSIIWNKKEKTDLLKGLSKIALPIVVINFSIKIIEALSLGNIGQIENLGLILGNIIVIALLIKKSAASITTAGAMGLIGILLSKYQSLISAQVIEPFKGFGRAYIERRLQYNYIPTVFECFVSVLLIGLAVTLFYFLYRIFPLTREE